MKYSRITMKPIGFVRNKTTIEISPDLSEALLGIGSFSHILVFFWMDRVGRHKRQLRRVKPCTANHFKGVFATRMPFRPNPIGFSIVRLVRRKKNVLIVDGIDALDNTPVLDIKPYTGKKDLILQFRVPSWTLGRRRA